MFFTRVVEGIPMLVSPEPDSPPGARSNATENAHANADSALIRVIQGGLPLVERPFAAVAAELGWTEEAVIERIRALRAQGAIKRLGVVVRHQELGYGANAMVVWDLPDAKVDTLGRRIGALPFVTLCYRRPRRPPEWPFNLFTMIHGRDRAAVLTQVAHLKADLETELGPLTNAVLFSGQRFKQRGAFYRPANPASSTATATTSANLSTARPLVPRIRPKPMALPPSLPAFKPGTTVLTPAALLGPVSGLAQLGLASLLESPA
jgi:DNA-binding Lrp family transcriptional regulator